MTVKLTTQPNSTEQAGAGVVTGAANAASAWGDINEGTFVTINGKQRNESARVRVRFPNPSIPAGAKVLSVTARDKVRTVVYVAGNEAPGHYGWVGCYKGDDDNPYRSLYFNPIPIRVTSEWVERTLGGFADIAPDGQPWDAESLSKLFYEAGRADGGGTAMDIATVWLDIVYQRQSTINVVGPVNGTESNPVVSWTFDSDDDEPQEEAAIAIYTAAQAAGVGFVPFETEPIQHSGSSTGTVSERYWIETETTQWTVPGALVDGSYVAYVKTKAKWAGSGDFVTATDSIAWTRDATPATPPPAAVLNSATYDYTKGWVELDIDLDAAADAYTVQANVNGVFFADIPHLTNVPSNGATSVTAWDGTSFEQNAPVEYRVIALSEGLAAGSASNVIEVTPIDLRDWVFDPEDPLNGSPVLLKEPESGEGAKYSLHRTEMYGQPLGAEGTIAYPRRILGAYHGEEHKMTLIFNHGEVSENYWDAVQRLYHSNTVKWRRPNGTSIWGGIGGGLEGQPVEVTYKRANGNVKVDQWRNFDFMFTQLEAPQ